MPSPERRASDTPRSYAALCDYAGMGAGRSLEKLAGRYRTGAGSVPTRRLTTLKDWSRDDDWQARVQAYDAAILAEEEAARQAIRQARRLELEEMDWEQGGMLRQRVVEIAAEMPKFIRRTVSRIEQDGKVTEVVTLALAAGPGELVRALKLASELQRLSVGEPTDRTEISGPNGGPIRTEVYDYSTAIAGITARSGADSDTSGENASFGDGSALGEKYDGRGD